MRKALLVLFLLVSLNNWAQVNLVPNYSFEQINSCPYSGCLFDTTILNWFQPSEGTTDIFNTCANVSGGRSIPSNSPGYQFTQHGDGYAGIVLYYPGILDYREYIAVRLLDTLKSDVNYCIKFYVSLSEQYPKKISSIGMHFSPDSIYQNDWNVLQVTPQFENFNGNFINDTTSWLLIKGNYTASGGEKYIYIGNFRNDANTIVDNNSVGSRTYVYIDNVQLYECDSLIGIKEEPVKPLRIFPNPSSGQLYVEILPNENGIFEIYDTQGKIVYRQAFKAGNAKIEVNINSNANGLYLCRIIYESGKVETGKLLLQQE